MSRAATGGPEMKRLMDRRPAGLAALAVVCAALSTAGCGSSATTRMDVSVTIDPALNLNDVKIDIQGGSRAPAKQDFPITGGRHVRIAAANRLGGGCLESRAPVPGDRDGDRLCEREQAAVVTDVHAVNVWSGQHVSVQLTLSAACLMKTCLSTQHCSGGSCMDIPVTGPSLDGGMNDSAGSGGKVGSGGHGGGGHADTGGQSGARGLGGGAGSSQPVDAHPADGGNVDAGTDTGPTKSAIGHKCSTNTDCGSGFCAQGVCCMTACTQSCYACTNALTGSSPDGTCAVVSSGLGDPAGTCVAGTATSCGNTGHCDGKGACEKFGSSTVCQPATCGTSGFTSAGTCNGKGTCTPGTNIDCKGFTCSATSGCATACSADTDCPGGYCTATKTCAATVPDGTACSKSTQCTHGNCVAGICCATACTGTCMTCATGLCKPVAAGGSSAGACATGTTTCGHDGTCDGNGGCRFATSTVSCGTASCSSGQLTPAGTCNGAGACSTPAASGCAGGVICASASACKSSTCTANGDCVSGLCSGGTCASKRPNGQACTAPEQCTSNFCVDGVCCNNVCNGTCQSCAETTSGHTPGTCATISGTPRSGHGSCTGTGVCASTCTGSSTSCAYPSSPPSCRSASCSGGSQTLAAVCDGAGNCPAAVTQTCGQFVCGTNSCVISCSSNSQCVSGAACVNSSCTACTGGKTVCPNACANLLTDSSNCGSCGHSCLGGTCSSGTCAPVTLATLPVTAQPAGLALNGSTVFTTVPSDGSSKWALYGVPKTAVNSAPSPILTRAVGNLNTGFLGANDSSVFGESGYTSPGGNSFTVFSCNPSSCSSTAQDWYTTAGDTTACDPSAQECFDLTPAPTSSTVRFAKQGAASQTSPQDFNPVLTMAVGFPAATGGFLMLPEITA